MGLSLVMDFKANICLLFDIDICHMYVNVLM